MYVDIVILNVFNLIFFLLLAPGCTVLRRVALCFLNVTKSRKQVLGPAHTHTHFSVGADRSQPPREQVQMSNSFSSLLTEGNTAGSLVSDDSVAGHTRVY